MIFLVLFVKDTQSREQSISGFDYMIILYGAMFDFADVTENEIASSVHWRLLLPCRQDGFPVFLSVTYPRLPVFARPDKFSSQTR